MQELETLLNSLIQRGWKPEGFQGESEIKISEYQGIVIYMKTEDAVLGVKTKLRNLVSLESWLWQFVCSHLLIWPNKNDWLKNADVGDEGYITSDQYYTALNYQYRLLESALIPEEELAQFLVENIKLEWNSK